MLRQRTKQGQGSGSLDRAGDESPEGGHIPPDIKPPGATASQLLPPLSAKNDEEGSPQKLSQGKGGEEN